MAEQSLNTEAPEPEDARSSREADLRQEEPPEVDDLEAIIEGGDDSALDAFLAVLHPADLADLFQILDRDHWPKVLSRLSIAQTSNLMEELPDHLRDDLAEHLRQDRLAQVIEDMASDDAVDVLADLPKPLARLLIQSLDKEDRREIEALLRYPEDSAGGLMQTELISVATDATVDQAIEAVRVSAGEAGEIHYVYVVDDARRLVGMVKLEQLILARGGCPVRELMEVDHHVVTPDVDQEKVGVMFVRYDLIALPVVDEEGRLLGRILHDDVVDVLQEEATEDIMHMAGASPDEPELVYTDQVFKIAWVRLPWLLATLAGLTIPALLVWAFQLSFPQMLVLIPFIPVIGAMGGNVGTQSSTIVVRGFASGRVDFNNLGRFLRNELVVSLLMGLACGLASAVVAVIWHQDYLLCAIVGFSMTVAIVASAIMGVLVPYLFRMIRIDPAIAAGPAVTTIDDILAIGIYYGVALVLV